MNFINVSSFKKAQIILRINAFLLFLFIVATPYLIKEGIRGMPEAVVEGVFLAIEIGVLIRLFKNYDFHSSKSDRKANQLSGELREQQELSADTFKYLGKMNVQMSIIKQLVKRFKAPAEKKRLEDTMSEMLQIIAGLIGNKKVSLRIINLNDYKTINEISLTDDDKAGRVIKNVTNKNLCKGVQDIIDDNLQIISSDHDNFSLKTFVMIDESKNRKNKKIDNEQLDLVQDIVNQCEIVYLLFKSKYHK